MFIKGDEILVRVSNKARVNAGLLGKVVLTALFSSIAIVAVVLASYKPVYSVLINGEFKGYVSSKKQMQQDIEKYLQEGDSERVGYILLKNRPEYEFGLVRKDVDIKDSFNTNNYSDMQKIFLNSDIIINTVPSHIIPKYILEKINCYFLDVASYPYAINKEDINNYSFKYELYSQIPSKYDPKRAGKILLKKF